MIYNDLKIGQACLIKDFGDEIVLLKTTSDRDTKNNVIISSTTDRFPIGFVGGINVNSVIKPVSFKVIYK